MKRTQKRQKIVIIGCGNLAWHLALHLSSLNKFDLHVYNHQPNKQLSAFKRKLNCTTHESLADVINDAQYYVICVSDQFIRSVSAIIKPISKESLVIHTSGSKSINELNNKKLFKGVFYPVQTFSKQSKVKWKSIPVLIEGNNIEALSCLRRFAKLFSEKIKVVNSSDRSKVHLSAVLVNNFTNSMIVAADQYLNANLENGDLKLLMPLIEQTFIKICTMDPADAQTGPAKRNDQDVIKQHLKNLKSNKQLARVYREVSNLIIQQQNEYNKF